MIAIIDYGMGNLRSVQKGFEKCGFKSKITGDPEEVLKSSGIVVPGVGAFGDAMKNLRKTGMEKVIIEAADMGKPVLGICLGYQLLFTASEEWGYTEGIGLLPGKVRRLPSGVKVPHMGWNQVEYTAQCILFDNIPSGSAFYFVHSYYVKPDQEDMIASKTDYGIKFASSVSRKNVFGVQFHPEKSSALGLRILHNFGGLVFKC